MLFTPGSWIVAGLQRSGSAAARASPCGILRRPLHRSVLEDWRPSAGRRTHSFLWRPAARQQPAQREGLKPTRQWESDTPPLGLLSDPRGDRRWDLLRHQCRRKCVIPQAHRLSQHFDRFQAYARRRPAHHRHRPECTGTIPGYRAIVTTLRSWVDAVEATVKVPEDAGMMAMVRLVADARMPGSDRSAGRAGAPAG